MKRVLLIFIALICVAGVSALALEAATLTMSLRYKVTVSIDTPEGLKQGSAVRQLDVRLEPRPGYRPHPYHSKHSISGEAVVVDLGTRGLAFAPLGEEYLRLFDVFPGPPGFTPDGIEYYSALKPGLKAEMVPENYPYIVMFENLEDPASLRMVRGTISSDTKLKHVCQT